jgi:hypothetical protein
MSPRRCWLCAVLLFVLAVAAHAELTLSAVRSDKIYYLPAETAQFAVTVTNPDAVEAAATLRVELISDVDTATVLAEQAVTVPAQGEFAWSGSRPMDPVLGMELRATLLRNSQPLATRSDYFSCARSVHQVLMYGFGDWSGWQFSGTIDANREPYAQKLAGELQSTYGNAFEKFGWAPSDFDCLTPTYDRWWAGQGAYNECKSNMLVVIKALHQQGLRVITYGKAAGGGNVTFDLYRRRPELVPCSNGRPAFENYSAAYLDYMLALGPPHRGETRPIPGTPEEMEKAGYKGAGWFQPYTPGGQNWCAIWYDAADPDVAIIGIGELVGSARVFGFDGVRFDGEFTAGRYQRLDGSWSLPEKSDFDALNTALTQRMKKACWAYDPRYLFGYNAGTDITWSIAADNTPRQFREKCKDEGLIANEAQAFPGDITWTTYALRVRREAEIVRYYGGHYATYAFDRSANKLYNCILQYGLRAHLMNPYVGPGKEWVARSATRFSRLLWDQSLSTWRGAEQVLTVSGSRELLWKEFAAVGAAPGGGTRYVIHLYNPPESPTTYGKEQVPAAPATGVEVRWPGLTGFQRAWLVDMEKTTATPVTPVTPATGGAFAVGELPVWKILVVDVAGTPPAPTYEPAPTGPASGPSATDLQIARPAETSGGQQWRTVVEPERWGGGEDVAERVSDPAASAGGAVRGTAGGKTGSMAYTYEYARTPGRYRCTFRLKVADNTGDQPVFQLATSHSMAPPFAGLAPLFGETKTVKASDFAQPNVYQNFTADFDFADYGYMGAGVNYLGNVTGWWDSLTIDLIRPWTAAELADYYKGFQRPEGLKLVRGETLSVLAVRGLFNRLYQINAAVAGLPGAQLWDAYTSYHQQQGTMLTGYRWDWKPLWNQDVIILADVETKGLNYGQVLMLSEWVKDGGGLIILGGPLTLGQDENMTRAWPLLLPVELNAPWEIRKCSPPVKLFGGTAAVMYRHLVKAKPDAAVLLKGAGGEPLIVGRGYGQGRVAVFTGTPLGEASAGSKAFWETPEWIQTMRTTILWVAGRK